jgi:hypothetical protein
MKKVNQFKTGTNDKHDSLFDITSYSFSNNPTKEEFEEYSRDHQGDPKTVDDELNELCQWAGSVMKEKAKSLGKSECEKHDDPVFFSGLNAIQKLHLAYDFKHQNDYASAFNALLSSIPAMLDLQILEYQDQIILGTKALNGPKDRLKDLTKKSFQAWLRDNEPKLEGLNTMPELMALDKFTDVNQIVQEPTIRKWFKEVCPDHYLRTGAPKKE